MYSTRWNQRTLGLAAAVSMLLVLGCDTRTIDWEVFNNDCADGNYLCVQIEIPGAGDELPEGGEEQIGPDGDNLQDAPRAHEEALGDGKFRLYYDIAAILGDGVGITKKIHFYATIPKKAKIDMESFKFTKNQPWQKPLLDRTIAGVGGGELFCGIARPVLSLDVREERGRGLVLDVFNAADSSLGSIYLQWLQWLALEHPLRGGELCPGSEYFQSLQFQTAAASEVLDAGGPPLTLDIPDHVVERRNWGVVFGNWMTEDGATQTMVVQARVFSRGRHPHERSPVDDQAFGVDDRSRDARIHFSLQAPTAVRLAVYDARGRLVSSLLDGRTLHPGKHVVRWGATNARGSAVGSGVYFARLQAGERVRSSRIVVLR